MKNWGIKEIDILREIDRQDLDIQEDQTVTLFFAMKWFNSDLTNKGFSSDLVKGLLLSQADQESITSDQ